MGSFSAETPNVKLTGSYEVVIHMMLEASRKNHYLHLHDHYLQVTSPALIEDSAVLLVQNWALAEMHMLLRHCHNEIIPTVVSKRYSNDNSNLGRHNDERT